jgi:hypothetical protein
VVAVDHKGEVMKLYSFTELFNLSRAELFALHQEAAALLDRQPIGSPEHDAALSNLRMIRYALAGFRPRPG